MQIYIKFFYYAHIRVKIQLPPLTPPPSPFGEGPGVRYPFVTNFNTFVKNISTFVKKMKSSKKDYINLYN